RRRMIYSLFESSCQDKSNGGKFVFLRSLDGQIFDETSKIGIFYIYDTAPLTFRQISHHPMIIEGCTIAHSNRLVKTNRMTVNLSFHDHWMARYLMKRQM